MTDPSERRFEHLVALAESVGLETDAAQLETLREGVGYLEEYLRRLHAKRPMSTDSAHVFQLTRERP